MALLDPPDLQRVSHIEQRDVGVLIEIAGEPVARGVEGPLRPSGHAQDTWALVLGPSDDLCGRLFEDDVRVRPTNAERTHPGAPGMFVLGPRTQLRVDMERGVLDLEFRVG